MIRRPPRSTPLYSSAASDVYKRQPASVNVRIEILNEKGAQIDAFTAVVPMAGGMQLNDLFRSRGLGDGPTAALIRVSPAGGMVGAYATTIDNGTTDSTYFAANLGAK